MLIRSVAEAKFRIPKFDNSSKEFDQMYRPSAHLIGCLIPGVAEIFFLTDGDVRKDSSTTLTCVSRSEICFA